MTDTLYYTIRYRDPFELLDVKLNIELENAEDARELRKYARGKTITYMSFDDSNGAFSIMDTLLRDIDDERFLGGIPNEYLKGQVVDPNNNLLILFSLSADFEVQIEGVLTYHQITKRGKNSVKIPAVAIIDLHKDRRLHVSGATLIHWFYRKIKDAGGYSIEIDAVGTSMKFWREKMGFSYRKLNPRGKRATIILEIDRKRQTMKSREDIDRLYYHIPSAPMRRVRSDASVVTDDSPDEDSPLMLSLQDIDEIRNPRSVSPVSFLRRTRSAGTPEKRAAKKTSKRRRSHSK